MLRIFSGLHVNNSARHGGSRIRFWYVKNAPHFSLFTRK